MILRRSVVAGVALGALAALAVVAEPALAGTCVAVTVKGRGAGSGHGDHQGGSQTHSACRADPRQGQEEFDQLPKGAARRLRVHHLGGSLPLKLNRRYRCAVAGW